MTSSDSGADDSTYWPIYIARSDGQGYQNLDHQPLDLGEVQDVTQHERWEVIIGFHLANQLAPKVDSDKKQEKQYKLGGFPRGYELRCAVRGKGGRDYYLYGHPAGPKANYRTPGEFALHALWLASESSDNSQCPCDLCLKYLEKGTQERDQTAIPTKQSSLPAAAAAPQQSRLAQQVEQLQQLPQLPQSQQTQQLQQARQAQRPSPQQGPQSLQPPPGITGLTNVFRLGELVWYKHTAWRLGVIISISAKPEAPTGPAAGDADYNFTLTPLGHVLLPQQRITKDSQSMRPFLTFSVPGAALPELKDKTFDTVHWASLAEHCHQEPDAAKRNMNLQVVGLEASKMGARAINDAFSTFNLMREGYVQAASGAVRVQYYEGVYLGAEMVRVGDPLRITNTAAAAQSSAEPANNAAGPSPDGGTLVMRVDEIQVFVSPDGGRSTLYFQGNHYRPVRARAAAAAAAQPPVPGTVPAETLGPAFVEELAARNAAEKDPSMRWCWAMVQGQARRGEHEVQGRFYVTEKLMKVIDPDLYQTWVQRGLLEEAPAYLNNRGHSGGGQYSGRRPGRAATLGQAVAIQFEAPVGMVEN